MHFCSCFLFWHKYRAIILNLPTGRGKTTFIVDCILSYAISHNIRVLIVSNRISLDTAIKKQISKILGLYEDYPDELLRKTDDFGLVTITTYQKLPTYLKNKDFCKSISYAVFDEAHYFTSDASFSELTEWVLKKIPEKFSEAVRIYMSATISEVLPYICQAECNQKAIERWHLRFNTDKFFKDWLIRIKNPAIRERYPEMAQMLAEDSIYAPYYPTPKIYKMKADYSNVQLKFYSDSSIIKDVIDRSDSKSVVFVANKKMGKQLSEEIENSAYMNEEINSKSPELMNRIIETESFDEKVLITTSVFCNGCNICDENVKNVFIECLDQTDILQMAGRKRKLSENDTYTLYLRIPSNTAHRAEPPKIVKSDVNYFQPEQIIAIEEASLKEPINRRVLIHLLLITGARRGELLGLKWCNVDFENNRIYICNNILYSPDIGVYESTPKTKNSKRYISLPIETMQLLTEYKSWQDSRIEYFMGYYQDKDYVFAQDNGNPIHPDSVTDYLSKFSKKYNLPHINAHAFRHTMASLLYYNGADSVSISNRLGHAQVSTTANIYAHIINNADRKNAELLSGILKHKKQNPSS